MDRVTKYNECSNEEKKRRDRRFKEIIRQIKIEPAPGSLAEVRKRA